MWRACVFLFLLATPAWAGLKGLTERGKTDFDTVLQVLNPYGGWAQIDGTWAWTPFSHAIPYTEGRWLYTDYGWLWRGDRPESWATEHYGYWKRGADKVWSWYPLPSWLPEIVELRGTPTHLGWRPAAVDHDGNFTEAPADRYARTDEWSFVTLAQFTGPINPAVLAPPAVVQEQLENSTDSSHTYLTYRAIGRPGPHPADLTGLVTAPGMLPATTPADRLALPTSTLLPGITPGLPDPVKLRAATTNTTVANRPHLEGAEDDGPVDPRQVKYWMLLNLPDPWAKPPADAAPDAIYLYRPEFYQDEDGVARRVAFWLNPKARAHENLKQILSGGTALLPTNAAPAEPLPKTHDPFHSTFEDIYPDTKGKPSPPPTTNAPAAPSGLAQ